MSDGVTNPLVLVNPLSSRTVVIACLVFAAFAGILAVLYAHGLAGAADAWSREEYGYGYFVPLLAIFLLWHKLSDAIAVAPDHRWVGPLIAVFAVALGVLGALGRIADLSGYGFILAIVAGCVSLFGLRATVMLWAPLVYLIFLLPLPQVVYLKLSADLQFISSELGVALVRLVGIPVLLEGNIIDLGIYRLQVAEACSGLRYLFPLMSFGYLFAVLFRGPTWQKWALFLSTIPITIVMNSVRIGVIAVLVTHFGTEAAEGFLHYFQGWIIFLCCIALLFVEAFLLWRMSGHRGALRDAFNCRPPPLPPKKLILARFSPLAPIIGALGLMVLGLTAIKALPEAGEATVPAHRALSVLPLAVADWRGKRMGLQRESLRVLAADDHFYAVYDREARPDEWIDFFVAYYSDQRDGRAVHSPEVCLPGAGWEVRSFDTVTRSIAGRPPDFQVNRAVIQKGLSRAIVYYWFEGRGRTITNQYAAKWYILWDGLTRNRTDGALVRLVTPVLAHGGVAAGEARLNEFLLRVTPQLSASFPR